ncbi:hypothetical protein QYE76_041692 [Lolium multiflorum]|uniref:Uncharacterized protein n=1 Tax=Lolium multiflorum TaxID=4521 RepID=A0AAD8TDV8_LOLMU|nr:hypothetical protein QYE76_041692 [Lolium multiflorum]
MGKERCCLRGLDHLHGPTSHSICGNLMIYLKIELQQRWYSETMDGSCLTRMTTPNTLFSIARELCYLHDTQTRRSIHYAKLQVLLRSVSIIPHSCTLQP